MVQTKAEEIKTTVSTVNELSESYVELIQALKGTTREIKAAKNLWRNGSNPVLIKLGLALIVFPEPLLSDILGTFLIATGTVQQGIRKRTIYVDNVYKTFQDTIKEIRAMKNSL